MSNRYTQYYQSGGSLRDIGPIYRGPYYNNQKGEGIGDFFTTAFRFLNPLLRSGLSVLGNQAIQSGSNILSDLGKKDLGTIVKEQGEQAIKNLSEKAINKIKRNSSKQTTTTTQVGKGRRKIHNRYQKTANKMIRRKRGRKPGRKSIKTSSFNSIDHIPLRRSVGRNVRKAKRIQIGGKRKAKRRTKRRFGGKRRTTRHLDIFS